MLFSQAATAKTLYPVGLAMGVPPLMLLVVFPALNGYFFLPNYPTVVAAIGFDRTGTTRIGKYVINHSFQLYGFIKTFVSIAVCYLIVTLFYKKPSLPKSPQASVCLGRLIQMLTMTSEGAASATTMASATERTASAATAATK